MEIINRSDISKEDLIKKWEENKLFIIIKDEEELKEISNLLLSKKISSQSGQSCVICKWGSLTTDPKYVYIEEKYSDMFYISYKLFIEIINDKNIDICNEILELLDKIK